ncbi:hypothetical protein [Tahibacter amnicola]|uniref:Uncharacterized protein n=1 Tax=Tahibacter amnicola TaxID=2976241 RepID=A0ABY6BHD1_9GAMM|nr:hypothetical protein [Tahibacter amnicola]UXI69182.1 hypothetical protein N4264_05910 [Tahibacter amnicola]
MARQWMMACVLLAAGGMAQARAEREDGWSIDVPECARPIERVPGLPLYDAQARAEYAVNPAAQMKPDYSNMPAHLKIDLAPCYGDDGAFDAALRILPVDPYLRIMAPADRADPYMEEAFSDLRHWIRNADPHPGDWPMVPYLDMSPMYTAGQKRLAFGGGRGKRVVTQFVNDVDFARSRQISYVFQGLSADNQHFVLLTVPLTVEGLAERDAQTHLDFTMDALDQNLALRDEYGKAIAKHLREKAASIRPALEELDRIVMGIRRTAPPSRRAR